MQSVLEERDWTTADSAELFGIPRWGGEFVSVNDLGNLVIRPPGVPGPGVDLKSLVDELVERGITPPLLIRFSDLLRSRMDQIHGAFSKAMKEFEYAGAYRPVYPIKVNQDRYLVEDIVAHGGQYHHGLEAGSKPELLAVMAMLQDPEALIICNGYKDEDYVEAALLASRIGPRIIIVAEKFHELQLVARVSRRLGIAPTLGVRARLRARGSGHWEESGGDRSKFGLSAKELMEAVRYLGEEGLRESLVLLHFHLGSQISSIRSVKDGVREASWIYVNLRRLGVPLAFLDVGGGLGVDYDGTRTSFPSSVNYTLQEYANDIVYGVLEVCQEHEVPVPTLVTESGRATVAHHAVLVTEALAVADAPEGAVPSGLDEDTHIAVSRLFYARRELTAGNARETYHDALAYREECLTLFGLGHLLIEDWVMAEDIFWALCRQARELLRDQPGAQDEVRDIEKWLADTYFCNFSVFQSLPDSWAIDQLFPIVPVHRLLERPQRRGVLADITCDSDGKIDRFTSKRGESRSLDLHVLKPDEPYYLAIFLVGAYQEILGDLHNLFGDTNAVHVALEPDGGYRVEHVVQGDTVSEVLAYVGHRDEVLVSSLRRGIEIAMREGRMTREQARQLTTFFQENLSGYTYLESR